MKIGIDLDNTIVDYALAARAFSAKHGHKRVESLSDLRFQFKNSDNEYWQFIQSWIYTRGLGSAKPSPGSLAFMEKVKLGGSELFIVSHKTERTSGQFGDQSLRTPALFWLEEQNVIPMLVEAHNVFFCETQEEKVKKIASLNLDWFIDDLLEVLVHPKFPLSTSGFWYQPSSPSTLTPRKLGEPTPIRTFDEIIQLFEDQS